MSPEPRVLVALAHKEASENGALVDEVVEHRRGVGWLNLA